MKNRLRQASFGRRVGRMVAVWLLLGAVIGGMGDVGIIAGAIGGMIMCSVPGTLIGLVGGDAIGTLVGASLLGLAAITGAPIGLQFGMMFGGLAGGTIRPWIRMSYRLVLGVWFVSHSLARRLSALTVP